MDRMTEVRKSPSGRGRNYTPLGKKWCNCALPGASYGQQMISADFQSAPIITGENFPLRWLSPATPLQTCRLKTPCVANHFQPAGKKSILFVRLMIYNRDSDKSKFFGGVPYG